MVVTAVGLGFRRQGRVVEDMKWNYERPASIVGVRMF